jgi:hypothetical protein
MHILFLGGKVIFFYFVIIFLFSFDVFSAELVLTPFVDIHSEYNGNILFSRQSQVSDGLSRLGAGMIFERKTSRMNFEAFSFLEAERFFAETELDTENFRLGMEGGYRLSRRLRFQGRLAVTKDNTLETDIEEIGVVGTRDRRYRYQFRGALYYQLTERLQFRSFYSFLRSDFDGMQNVDIDDYSVRALLAHKVDDGRGEVRGGGNWSASISDGRDRYTLSPFIGYFYQFSELLEFQVQGGFRFTNWDFQDPRPMDDQTQGGWLDLSLIRQLETVGARLGYNRDLATKSSGEDLLVDKFYLNFQYRWLPRWVMEFEGNLFFTQEEGEGSPGEETTFFELISSINYKLSENYDLEFGYNYAREKEDSLPAGVGSVATRNRLWIKVQFRFPSAL